MLATVMECTSVCVKMWVINKINLDDWLTVHLSVTWCTMCIKLEISQGNKIKLYLNRLMSCSCSIRCVIMSYYLYLFFVILILFHSDHNAVYMFKIQFKRNASSNLRIYSNNSKTSNDFNTVLSYFIYLSCMVYTNTDIHLWGWPTKDRSMTEL
jgi:hypothetical protein